MFGDNLGLKLVNHSKIINHESQDEVPESTKNWPLQGMFDSIIYFGMNINRHFLSLEICIYRVYVTEKMGKGKGPVEMQFMHKIRKLIKDFNYHYCVMFLFSVLK